MDTCPFCEIIEQNTSRKLYEGEHVFATLSNPRLVPGHTLVIPKRHVHTMGELTKEERSELIETVTMLENRILKEFAAGCDIVQNYRPFVVADNYYKVNHLHVHLQPREAGDRLDLEVKPHHRKVFGDLPEDEREKYTTLIFGFI
jgi:diadenosine tetraphosphate (Ap4A) HIT family hydrolase